MFKEEASGSFIEEFVGLRSKLYSFKIFDDGTECKKCKGINQQVVRDFITMSIKKCLLEEKEQYRKMVVIRSYNHQLYTEEVNKITVSGDDDKDMCWSTRLMT